MTDDLKLTKEWDKTFPKSEKVEHSKVCFHNRYGITLAADMYIPVSAKGKLPAIAVCGPFGAVKEQASGLYAQTMAKRGFLTIAFDPSFTGESGGEPRYMASPDINTEDFQAAVDFLSLHDRVDPLPEDAPFFVRDYHDYYKTKRGYHARSLNSNGGWNVTGCMSFLNQPILQYSNEIRSAVLIMYGEKAHSCYFSRDAYADMVRDNPYTDNKELLIIPDAVHTDLYDGGGKDAIPFDRLEEFFRTYLK